MQAERLGVHVQVGAALLHHLTEDVHLNLEPHGAPSARVPQHSILNRKKLCLLDPSGEGVTVTLAVTSELPFKLKITKLILLCLLRLQVGPNPISSGFLAQKWQERA